MIDVSPFDDLDLGPASPEDFAEVVNWVEKYQIADYIGSGSEDEAEKIDPQ